MRVSIPALGLKGIFESGALDVNSTTLAIYTAAAFARIAGCYAFWAWLRLGKPVRWIVSGLSLLLVFAWLPTRVDAGAAGRTYAAYGGIYILNRWHGFGLSKSFVQTAGTFWAGPYACSGPPSKLVGRANPTSTGSSIFAGRSFQAK